MFWRHYISYKLVHSSIFWTYWCRFKKQVSHESTETDVKKWSSSTFPVVKLESVSWTHEMTGVILYFANTDIWSCVGIHCSPPYSMTVFSLDGKLSLSEWGKKRSGSFHYLTMHSSKKQASACLFIYMLKYSKSACVLLHKLSPRNGNCLLNFGYVIFFLRQQLNCRVSGDLFVSTKALFSQWPLLTCWPGP